jgi:opacity protein-like surface antigen
MIHKFKTLGLATIAVLAMSAAVASAAQAQFEASSYPTTVTATSALGNSEFKTEGGSFECEEHWEGTLSEASNSLAFNVTYTNCKAFGFAEATLHGNGCYFTVHRSTQVDIKCPPGKVMETTAGTCVIHVGEQTGLQSIGLATFGSHVELGLNLGNVKYYVTKDPFLCPFFGVGPRTGGGLFVATWVTTKPVKGGTSISVTVT